MPKPAKPNKLYFGDNLPVLRDHIPDESVDLIYLDPPFNSKKEYNVLFKEKDGSEPVAQIKAFGDTWHWNQDAQATFTEIVESSRVSTEVAELVRSLVSALGRNEVTAYLVMMAIRLVELRRVLKPTGSIYLHCDPTAGSHLKVLMDAIFSPVCFRNQITWKRSSAHSDTKQGMAQYGRICDTILFYTRGAEWTWNPQYTPYDAAYAESEYRHSATGGRCYKETDPTAAKPGGDTEFEWRVKRKGGKRARWEADLDEEYRQPQEGVEYKGVRPYHGRFWAYSKDNLTQFWRDGKLVHRSTGMPRLIQYADQMPGIPLQDLWTDTPPISAGAAERLGYPTQKPEALLERIITASSNEGDVILDPFCGCGTSVAVAQRLCRRWIGIDITHLAIGLIRHRLRDHYGDGVEDEYEVLGVPADVEGARALAQGQNGRYQFQWWALDLVDARTVGEKRKKGADKGIDGVVLFCDEADSARVKKIIVSVKSGHVGHSDILELRGVVEKENAEMGFFVTLEQPTPPMRDAALSAGYYETPFLGTRYPKIQILTIRDLLAGEGPKRPPKGLGDLTFAKAPRAKSGPAPRQGTL